MGGGWPFGRSPVTSFFCHATSNNVVRRGLSCELGLSFLKTGVEILPGVLVGVVGAKQDAEPRCVVGYGVCRIVVSGKIGVFDGLWR